ncbi:hypothetical protein [Haloplanus pelagicus]|jgi:hypothetical protein|uniref:hypothetical protein n=1 Tax=Haloplanus pelagicus TaxID=2949995 RepID=UPI00203E4F15|nr:hypothetical protein [Haloplanus sp. HW8-1]
MFDDTDRRRFLQLAGTGTALSMAGCSALSNHNADGGGGGGGDGGAEMATVTLGVQPDEQSMQELQAEIRSQVESGELDRTEAQREFRSRRIELTRNAVSRFRNRTGNISVTVDDTVGDFGVMLVTGDPEALLDSLQFEEVNGLFPASVFEEARTQASSETTTPGTETETA